MTAAEISSSPDPAAEVDSPSPYQVFLEAVAANGGLDSTYDARDIAEVVFRSIRDLMPTEASNRIAAELDEIESGLDLQTGSIAQLWRDTNPLVRWLSQVRAPLDVRDEMFLRRIQEEAGVPKNVGATDVTIAVFGAIKAVLSSESNSEIAQYLPGQVRFAWNRA
ncbi:DUF2267 domain-containing protein [Synechococcus sp. PCC 7336]|uniref:DUF2267 domain-containing protein n=1 Tax=Synechococcus sp. PCC 7336 TaxID=195250 RepID=UPI00034D1914|nr:DUF2267 domain-containing protein [Synechococcus sp. PCC 7336]